MKNIFHLQFLFPAEYYYLPIISELFIRVFEDNEKISDENLYAIQLSVHELCTNIIEHAYEEEVGKRIDFSLSVLPKTSGIEVKLIDTGKNFYSANIALPKSGDIRSRGFGLLIVDRLMDSVEYAADNGENRWIVRKNLRSLRNKKINDRK